MSNENQIPRRNRLDQNTPAELAIRAAVDEVEKAGAALALTEVVVTLQAARERLADHIDGVTDKGDYFWIRHPNTISHGVNTYVHVGSGPDFVEKWGSNDFEGYWLRLPDGGFFEAWLNGDCTVGALTAGAALYEEIG